MTHSIKRRNFLGLAATGVLAGCGVIGRGDYEPFPTTPSALLPVTAPSTMPLFYGPLPLEQFPVPAVPQNVVPPQYWRKQVLNPYPNYASGSLVVDPQNFYLYLVQPNGTAMRYGIGVGKQGFAWSGNAVVQFKREWPRWKAPASMIARRPDLEPYSVENGGMDPGLKNPLGARALYLFENGKDTLYRIHGTPEAGSIGRAVSSGCIRMLNHDVIDIYNRVPNGAPVIVLRATIPPILS
ncbi:MAG: L,D-transpeptidase [Pseudomonadota bacterium]